MTPCLGFLILGDFSACGAGNNGQTALDRKDQATASSLEIGIAIPVGAKTTGRIRKKMLCMRSLVGQIQESQPVAQSQGRAESTLERRATGMAEGTHGTGPAGVGRRQEEEGDKQEEEDEDQRKVSPEKAAALSNLLQQLKELKIPGTDTWNRALESTVKNLIPADTRAEKEKKKTTQRRKTSSGTGAASWSWHQVTR